MKPKCAICILTTAIVLTCVFAQTSPPSPESIGATLSAYWASNQLAFAESYITNLYSSYSNYVPAIMTKAVYEKVWKNNPSNFLYEVTRVTDANVGSDYFKALVSSNRRQSDWLLQTYYSEGTSHAQLTNAASIQAIRNEIPEMPYLSLITNAPAVNLSIP